MTSAILPPALATASLIADLLFMTPTLLAGTLIKTHERHVSLFSPAPVGVAVLFGSFFVLSLLYLRLAWRAYSAARSRTQTGPANSHLLASTPADDEGLVVTGYAPYFAAVHFALGAWGYFWGAAAEEESLGSLRLSALCVLVMLVAQTAFVGGILSAYPLGSPREALARLMSGSPLAVTHLVAKIGLAVAIMDTLHNGSIAFTPYPDFQPGLAVKIGAGVIFTALFALSDIFLGAGLVAALVAITVGQSQYADDHSWVITLGCLAVWGVGVVGVRNVGFASRGAYERV